MTRSIFTIGVNELPTSTDIVTIKNQGHPCVILRPIKDKEKNIPVYFYFYEKGQYFLQGEGGFVSHKEFAEEYNYEKELCKKIWGDKPLTLQHIFFETDKKAILTALYLAESESVQKVKKELEYEDSHGYYTDLVSVLQALSYKPVLLKRPKKYINSDGTESVTDISMAGWKAYSYLIETIERLNLDDAVDVIETLDEIINE